jgi:hypothetical protein
MDNDDNDNTVPIVVITITTSSTAQCESWPSSKDFSALSYLLLGSSSFSPLEN